MQDAGNRVQYAVYKVRKGSEDVECSMYGIDCAMGAGAGCRV